MTDTIVVYVKVNLKKYFKGDKIMIYVDELQKITLKLVDDLINENKTFDEISRILFDKGYILRAPILSNGQPSKSKINLCNKKGEYSFVDLIKRRNGLATWQTVRLF